MNDDTGDTIRSVQGYLNSAPPASPHLYDASTMGGHNLKGKLQPIVRGDDADQRGVNDTKDVSNANDYEAEPCRYTTRRNPQDDGNTNSPPDGGWGWVVVVAVFFNHIIFDGSMFICGLFYVEFLEYFQSGKSETSWIGSLASGMCHLPGIFTSAMINKCGCRVTAMVGALLSAIGYFVSIFATDIYYLYFSFGALVGLGFSFMYVSSIVVIGHYFKERLSFATGLAVCGSGVGTFIMAPLGQWLIDTYDWKGAIMILTGVVANGLVCGATFAPVVEKRNCKKTTQSKKSACTTNDQSEEEPMMENSDQCGASTQLKQNELRERNGETVENGRDGSRDRRSATYFTSNMSIIIVKDCRVDSGSCETSENHEKKKIFNFSILKDCVFLLYGLHEVFATFGYLIPFLFLPDYAVTLDISVQNAAFLISVIGISNTIARVLLGFVCNLEKVRPYILQVYAAILILPGLVCAAIGFCQSYVLLVLCAVAYGLTVARFALTSTLLVDLFTVGKLTDIMGFRSLMLGVTALGAPPICGQIFDVTGSYTITFIIGGVVTAASGGILLTIPLYQRLHRKTKTSD